MTGARVPRRIMVMADYTDEALWDWEGFTGPINSWHLPLPEELRIALQDWARVQGQLAVTDFIWPDPEVQVAWQLQGLQLAVDVQRALGDDVEVDYSEAAPPRPPEDYPATDGETDAATELRWSSSPPENSCSSLQE